MLHRDLERGYLAISQPAHAWVSGQLARAWGNELSGDLFPREEVCLAAGQHDIGWLEWESRPTLNPETGRPRTFRELPTLEHLAVWEPAGPMALVYGPYVALLVSKHGTGLYAAYHDFTRDTEEEAEAARGFLSRGAAFEETLMEQIAGDSRYSSVNAPETVERNRRLVALWDGMSLAMCGGAAGPRSFDGIPARDGSMSITLQQLESGSNRFSVDPWPFREDSLTVTCAGRFLDGTFTSNRSLQQALERATWHSIQLELDRAA